MPYAALEINTFHEIGDLFWWIFGLALFVLVYWLGSLLVRGLRHLFRNVHLEKGVGLNRNRVDLIVRGVLVLAALIAALVTRLSWDEILSTLIPGAEFDEIAAMFAQGQDRFLVNIVLEVLFMQIALSLAAFIPFLLFSYVIRFVEWILCGEAETAERNPVIGLLLELVTIMAIGILSGCLSDYSMNSMLELIDQMDLFGGNFMTVILLTPVFILLIYLVVRDLFSSDTLLAIISLNVLAAFLQVEITPLVRIFLIVCAMGWGLLSGFLRGKLLRGSAIDTDKLSVFYGIGSAVVVFFLTWLLWTFVGVRLLG